MNYFKQVLFWGLAIYIFGSSFIGCMPKETTSINKYVLKINFPENSKYTFTTEQTQNISSMGIANIKQTISTEYQYEMLSEAGQPVQLAVIFKHLSFQSSSPAGNLQFNSADEDDTTSLFKNMSGVINQIYEVNFNENGRLQEVYEKNPVKLQASKDDLGKIMSDSTFTITVKNIFNVYPGKPVGIGETWHSESESNVANFKIKTKSTYTLKSIQDGIATISVSSILNLPQSSLKTDESVLKIQMEGTQKGFIHMRLDTGEVVKNESKQKVNAKINSMGQDLPMMIESELKGVSKRI